MKMAKYEYREMRRNLKPVNTLEFLFFNYLEWLEFCTYMGMDCYDPLQKIRFQFLKDLHKSIFRNGVVFCL